MGQSLVPLTPCWALEEVQVLLGLMACLGLRAWGLQLERFSLQQQKLPGDNLSFPDAWP